MKIYTKTGDEGRTGLLGSGRLWKDALRIEAYGTIDELNAVIGVTRSGELDPEINVFLAKLQDELFLLGSALADPNPEGPFHSVINSQHIQSLEQRIDSFSLELPELTQFILPGGASSAAHLHLARTICRRAERQVVALMRQEDEHVPLPLLIYLNRLSDLLFVLARVANFRANTSEVIWSMP